MANVWQLQEAKNCFSHVVDEAVQHGPQIITKHGRKTAVVMSISEYKRLIQQQDFVSFMHSSPLCGSDLDLERNKDLPGD